MTLDNIAAALSEDREIRPVVSALKPRMSLGTADYSSGQSPDPSQLPVEVDGWMDVRKLVTSHCHLDVKFT